MHELSSILEVWRQERQTLLHSDAVLATVVHVSGSAYRQPGARLLICPDRSQIGSISGGCLEGQVLRKAAWWTSSTPVSLRVFDTASDDEIVGEFGLGCQGVISVLFERFSAPGVADYLDYLSACMNARQPIAMAISLRPSNLGKRQWGSATPALTETLAQRQSRMVYDAEEAAFVEYIAPPQRLFLFGAGFDARPLSTMAAILGWQVHVVDGRPALAQARRFPEAQAVHLLPPSADISALDLQEEDAVVVLTHNFPLDAKLLPQLLARHPRYLGLLGPRKRADRLFAENSLPEIPSSVFAPTGLDIGAESPSTIALSVLAEIQASFSKRQAGFLQHRRTPIHDALPKAGDAAQPIGALREAAYCELTNA